MKTNIRTILILLFTVCTTTVVAQNPLHFGIKGGVNLSDYTKDIENNDIKVGYNAGITVDYRFDKTWYVMSGIEVASKGTRVKRNLIPVDNEIPITDFRQKMSYNPVYLQIPIHAGYRLYTTEDMAVLFHLGPFVSYGVGGKISNEVIVNGEKIKKKADVFGKNGSLKRWDVGLGIGVGLAFKEYAINFGYDLGFVDAHKGPESLKNNTAHISLSYRFL